LRLPRLWTHPTDPGEWFSDGGLVFANQWKELKSFLLPHYTEVSLLRRCSAAAFWKRLESLVVVLPFDARAALTVLNEHLPESLQKLDLQAPTSGGDSSPSHWFFTRLSQVPLRSLRLGFNPLNEPTLARILGEPTCWNLREFSLPYCGLTAPHARMIAAARQWRNLHSLDLSLNDDFGVDAARAIFSSEHLRSVVHLNLSGSRVRTKGVEALISSGGWERLRSLDLTSSWVDQKGLRALLDSPVAQRLTSLSLGESGNTGEPHIDVSPELATRMTQLPHLVRLCLYPDRLDRRIERILDGSESLPWVLIEPNDEEGYRQAHAAERQPPVEDVR
jgi:hypothetical protein